jgi:asparagine synthase (glutamine-hydrolysing)
MCGITGIAFADPRRPASRPLLQRMCDVMRHRGPDDEGFHLSPGVGLGMRRLSIIDLAGGHQPISNEDGTVHVVLNGEIYNYQALRPELEAKGHVFRTHSDTEVIVHLYEEQGEACVEALRGMFAFALWDAKHQRLLLARDRLGKKPLHYALLKDRLLFASEMKSILADAEVPRAIDPFALDQFLTFEYVPGERTMFRAIRRLLPGHRLVWEQGRLRTAMYWHLPVTPQPGRRVEEWCEALREELKEAVRLRLISDVPLGVLLSGGIDSATIVALMRQVSTGTIRTFSIGFEDQSYNELSYARLVAERFGTTHQEFLVRPDAAGLIDRLVTHFDEPFGDVSAIPTFLVCEMARRHVTVALGGDGGDELFGGYDAYLAQRIASAYERLPSVVRGLWEPAIRGLRPTAQKKGLINRAKRFLEAFEHPAAIGHGRWMAFLSTAEKAQLYTPAFRAQLGGTTGYEPFVTLNQRFAHLDPMARAMAVDCLSYLPDDILVKVDRMSMATSLEVRAPLLDHRVVELASTMPSTLKIRGGRTKWILREAMRGLVPAAVLNKPKQGFSLPVKNWLRHELKDLLLATLAPQRLQRHGYIEPVVVGRWVREHLDGRVNHAHRLWCLMMLELWHDRYLH